MNIFTSADLFFHHTVIDHPLIFSCFLFIGYFQFVGENGMHIFQGDKAIDEHQGRAEPWIPE